MGNRKKELAQLNDQLSQHIEIIWRCTLESDKYGRVLLATPPNTRYPYIYPRDTSSAVSLFRRVTSSPSGYDAAPRAFELMQRMAHFFKDVFDERSGWGQRYNLEGENKSIYKQEDNLAHGIAILCNYLLAADRLKKDIKELDGFLCCIDRAAAWSLENLYSQELHLFQSTTAVHESALEQGYTCWVNFSFLYAFSLVHEVANRLDHKGIISKTHLSFRRPFRYSVSELFISGDRYVRRISPEGHFDLRPDFTLLSPFYFGFLHYPEQLQNGVRFLEKQLWDSELSMIMRYLPFRNDFATHLHAGNGPWLQYSAILAQFHYWYGNRKGGDEILHAIDRYRNSQGEIPEHISTCKRFEEFMESEWKTGLDFAKEFHKPILLEQVHFDEILEETNNMSRSYEDTSSRCMFPDQTQDEGGFTQFATPLMWSHIEYARALLVRARDWWRAKKAAGP